MSYVDSQVSNEVNAYKDQHTILNSELEQIRLTLMSVEQGTKISEDETSSALKLAEHAHE